MYNLIACFCVLNVDRVAEEGSEANENEIESKHALFSIHMNLAEHLERFFGI